MEEKYRERTRYVVVAGVEERPVGLMVDSLLGEQEIVIEPPAKFQAVFAESPEQPSSATAVSRSS